MGDKVARTVADEIARFLVKCKQGEWTLEKRQEKFRRMGRWHEASIADAEPVAEELEHSEDTAKAHEGA
jgi:GMP synthase-like glutamine amidotransferase